jgi:HSP20 family molecular chaperone IbpA
LTLPNRNRLEICPGRSRATQSSMTHPSPFLRNRPRDLRGRPSDPICRAARQKPETVKIQPFVRGRNPLQLECGETVGEYTVIVPMTGIDLRQVFVVATPHTLLIEVRDRESVNYEGNGPVFSEIRDRRVSRELRLRHPIEKDVHLHRNANQLLITCRKTATGEEQSWSELLRFDTRASLGCV